MGKKVEKIQIKVKKPWEIAKGHNPHISGSGEHSDKRTKRTKTRESSFRQYLKDIES